ncbi:MAG: Wzt carbohydrate-binding domain-containing protein, partial [Acidimicrobiales bacterium]|nr:Wzt carbohydrate-binding domain-containing protein [Acidimicrobiales bacterium]
EFAELADFIDTPVKFYSSGMLMRLGFAVLVHIEPQVLLIDEVLAVGDGGFQTKCFDEMRRLQEQGTSIVLVSHSLLAVRHLCSRAVVIQRGQIEFDGDVEEGLARHVALMATESAAAGDDDDGDRAVLVLERELLTAGGNDPRAEYGQPVELRLRLRFLAQVRDPQIVLTVSSEAGMLVCLHATSQIPGRRTFEPGEETDVRIRLNAALGGGVYQLGVEVRDSVADVPPLRTEGVLLYVSPRPGSLGLADVQACFEVDGAACPP